MALTFSTALSGLRASSNAMSVTGNNIANANTVGYKESDTSFSDVYFNHIGSLQIGNGVRTTSTPTNFAQGTLDDSASPLSAAIQGAGFFVVRDGAGVQTYTRAGDFTLDRDGFLVTPTGDKVQGYAAINGVIPPGAAISSIQVPIGETVSPQVTSQVTLRMNLNAADAAGSEFHAPVQVYDSKGATHTLDLIFTKQTDGSYLMNATVDGNAAQASADGSAAQAAPVAFTFDSNGLLLTPATSLAIIPDQTQLGGATLPSININLRQTNPDGTPGAPNFTNFSTLSAVSSTSQDGYGTGALSGLSFSERRDGTLYAVFSNGQTRPIAQLALATFNSQNGLKRLGNNLYAETLASGPPSIGAGSSGGRGDVVGNALEQSNVDLASEFTDLMVAQRSFQANSRVITTINQTLQELLQII